MESYRNEIIDRCILGDVIAFEELVKGYEKKVYNISYSIIENKDDAMDVSQEVFIKIYNKITEFRGDSSFSTWLYRITVNTCYDFMKKRNRYKLTYIIDNHDENFYHDIPDNSTIPEDIFNVKELQKIVREAIKLLPYEQRIVVILRDIQQLSYSEISEVLDCSIGLVKSRLSRGRTKLRGIITTNEDWRAYSSVD